MNYQDINAETIDRWVKDGWEWGRPVSHETYVKAKQGTWDLHITPTKSVPHKWFGEIKGKFTILTVFTFCRDIAPMHSNNAPDKVQAQS